MTGVKLKVNDQGLQKPPRQMSNEKFNGQETTQNLKPTQSNITGYFKVYRLYFINILSHAVYAINTHKQTDRRLDYFKYP